MLTRVRVVVALKSRYPLPVLLAIAGLARSTFYYHQARLAAPCKHAELRQHIRQVFQAAKGRYGHRRVRLALERLGIKVSKKLVAKLMAQEGLVCITRPRRRYNSYQGALAKIAPNVLNRQFQAERPNQKWVSDITEFRVAGVKVYLSPIIDVYDGKVIAATHGLRPTTKLSAACLAQAITRENPEPGLIVHTDQGLHYQHISWRAQLKAAAAIQSMSRKGNCYDNCLAENFFSHLKAEFYHPQRFTSVQDFLTRLQDYLNWYNHHRIQERLKGLTPEEFRSQALAA